MQRKMTPLEIVGLVFISLFGLKMSRYIFGMLYNNFLAPKLGINSVNFKELGKWAVITGATDGLGKAYAEALAKKGMNLILISRTQSKLDTVAQEIATTYNVETKTIAVDFTGDGDTIYHTIDKQLTAAATTSTGTGHHPDIGVLVNNVGMSYPHPEYFLQLPAGSRLYTDIINCNVNAVTYMCRMVMPGMVERRRGVVINVSSTAAEIPSPLLTVYAATKAYVDKFTADLNTEYAQHGLIVQCVLPGYVATKMSKIRKSTWMAPSPRRYVGDALRTVGVTERTTGYFAHSLLVGVVNGIDYVSPRLSRWFIMRTMENIKKRAVRRNAASGGGAAAS